jgi:hypothetical protein
LFAPADTTNRPIPKPNEDQHPNARPSEDVPCSSSAPSGAERDEITISSTNEEDTHPSVPSVVTQNERKHVPIQTIFTVPLANSNAQKEREKKKSWIRCVSQQPLRK